jgi:hypothetical protein
MPLAAGSYCQMLLHLVLKLMARHMVLVADSWLMLPVCAGFCSNVVIASRMARLDCRARARLLMGWLMAQQAAGAANLQVPYHGTDMAVGILVCITTGRNYKSTVYGGEVH